MAHVHSLVVLALFATLATGCETAERTAQRSDDAVMDRTDLWPFWPTEMRIHPLTRIVRDGETEQPVIEVRVEFTDPQSIASRAAGTLVIELFDQSAHGASAVDVWNRDLSDPATNTQHFDDVTQTYLLRLQVDPGRLPSRFELRAHFLSDDEARLSATYEGRVPAAVLEP